jgi:hypothetical protein
MDFEATVHAWYDKHVRAPIDQHAAEIREHVEKAIDELKAKGAATEEEIHAWFIKHFHNSPVSVNTELFNYLQGAKAELLKLVKGGAQDSATSK